MLAFYTYLHGGEIVALQLSGVLISNNNIRLKGTARSGLDEEKGFSLVSRIPTYIPYSLIARAGI